MLMQTNSYIVPKDKRAEHARLMQRFRQTLQRIGCDQFEVYEQVGPEFDRLRDDSRFVQVLRFRDRQHHEAVQNAERQDSTAQDLIREFCELIDLEYQRGQSLFGVGFYSSILTSLSDNAAGDSAAHGTDPAAGDSQDFTTLGLPSPEPAANPAPVPQAASDSHVAEPHS
ncbi:MAG: hypothetical protein ACM359_20700 [Bacillota bacterium]